MESKLKTRILQVSHPERLRKNEPKQGLLLLRRVKNTSLNKIALRIKKFWGETENAVRIQIYSAITAYCMIAIVQKKQGIKRSIYEMLQIASISLTETTDLNTLFGKSNYNILNELNGSNEPTLI